MIIETRRFPRLAIEKIADGNITNIKYDVQWKIKMIIKYVCLYYNTVPLLKKHKVIHEVARNKMFSKFCKSNFIK